MCVCVYKHLYSYTTNTTTDTQKLYENVAPNTENRQPSYALNAHTTPTQARIAQTPSHCITWSKRKISNSKDNAVAHKTNEEPHEDAKQLKNGVGFSHINTYI